MDFSLNVCWTLFLSRATTLYHSLLNFEGLTSKPEVYCFRLTSHRLHFSNYPPEETDERNTVNGAQNADMCVCDVLGRICPLTLQYVTFQQLCCSSFVTMAITTMCVEQGDGLSSQIMRADSVWINNCSLLIFVSEICFFLLSERPRRSSTRSTAVVHVVVAVVVDVVLQW